MYTIDEAATVAIEGPPLGTTGVTITNPYAFWVQSGMTKLDGNLAVAGAISGSTGYAVRVYNNANISLTSSGVPQALTFNSERYGTHGFHRTSSNTSRLTVPAGGAGKYSIGASARFAAHGTGERQLRLLLNGATIINIVNLPNAGASST